MAVNFSDFKQSSQYFSTMIAPPSLNNASLVAGWPQWVEIGIALEVLAIASLTW